MMWESSCESTSAGSYRQASVVLLVAAVALFESGTAGAITDQPVVVADPGTSDCLPHRVECPELLLGLNQIASSSEGANVDFTGKGSHREIRSQDSIAELRRLSGLTWEQLARLCSVTPRTLHFWASGKATSAANEERLSRLLSVLKRVNQGSGRANRKLLLGATTSGELVLDLLQRGEFEQVVQELGEQRVAIRRPTTKLSEAAKAARRPAPPQERVDIDQSSLRHEVGTARGVRPVRIRRGEGR